MTLGQTVLGSFKSVMLSYLLLIPVVASYLVLVRSLRYCRINGLQKKYGSTPEQFKILNYRDAQTILGQMGLYECPWIFLFGKDFAFLRASEQILSVIMETNIDRRSPFLVSPKSPSEPKKWSTASGNDTPTPLFW